MLPSFKRQRSATDRDVDRAAQDPSAACHPRRLGRYCWLVEPASARGRPARWARGLLYCGLAAGPVFVTIFLAEGAIREGYRPSRHPVSSLALGPRGQVQTANFAVTGTLVLAGAAGLRHAADPALGSRAGRP